MDCENEDDSSNPAPLMSDYLVIMSKRMMTALIGFSRQSTIHSLSHLAQARNVKQRLFWLIIAFSASVGFLINLVNIIEKYLECPVLTNVFHDHRSFVFPDITFCLINPVRFPALGTPQYLELEKQIMIYRKFRNITFTRRQTLSYSKQTNYSIEMDLSDYLFTQPQVQYSHPPWSAIFICKYLQGSCNYKDFEVRHVWPYGNCFTFNVTKMGNTRDVKKSMIKNAWRPDFKIIVYKDLTTTANFSIDPFNNLNTPSGVLVMVHEADTYPYPDEGFIVDSYTQIDLKITTKKHLNVNNKCDLERENFNYFDFRSGKSTSFAGRQPDCIFEIIQSAVAERCKCLLQNMPVMDHLSHLPFCLAVEVNDTTFSRHSNLNECIKSTIQKSSMLNKKCNRDLCSHPSFSMVVSHSKYPAVKERQTQPLWLKMLQSLEDLERKHYNKSDLYIKAIKSGLKEKYNITSLKHANLLQDKYHNINFLEESFVDMNFMQIRIVPSSLFMDHIEEALEYTLSRLLGDIGGCVGLWVGASLITIFEFIDLIFRFGDLLTSYRYRPPLRKINFKTNSNSTAGNKNSWHIKNFSRLTEDDPGDLEDVLNATLMQPIYIMKNTRSIFSRQMNLEDL